MLNVLVLGSGGREHALAWKISQSEMLGKLYCLPGNPGTSTFATNIEGSLSDFEGIKDNVDKYNIGLVVIGPEDPLVNGIVDSFEKDPCFSDLLVIGPSQRGAMIEGSKDFAKEFMLRNAIPTARYKTFTADTLNEAFSFLETLKPPYVLKADGLAAGKGVLILNDLSQAHAELKEIFSGKFGVAGSKVVIEEFLDGIELSVFVLTDGVNYITLPEAKDYKRAKDGDKGLNTGGMGAVSPVPFADSLFMKRVEERIIKPTVQGLRDEKIKYKGFIFIGLMNCAGDPYVIEYNVRMGDPETEAVMPRIESDLLSHLLAAARGKLSSEKIVISKKNAVTVIATSGGYPESYVSGYPIKGLDTLKDVMLFHSGTKLAEGETVTKGGRVLAVTALEGSLLAAREKVYSEISKIDFTDIAYRRDIGLDILNLE